MSKQALARLYTRAAFGLQAPLVSVETHLSPGLPGFAIVGLPEMAVKESKDRVRSALLNSGFEFPTARIIVNLAPADLPKEGGRYDLPIALSILLASGQVKAKGLSKLIFAGELALSGELRPISGALSMALAAKVEHQALMIPEANIAEVMLLDNFVAWGAKHLKEVCQHIQGERRLTQGVSQTPMPLYESNENLSDVRGQYEAKRALTIAAAGGHGLLLIGTPGSGKTLLANRLQRLLLPLSESEAIEVASIYSLQGESVSTTRTHWRERPFRAPHHTATQAALIGGGTRIKPGEISLAHRGVLFLDELPEFDRRVLEVLREPMESGAISLSRAGRQLVFPAQFQLIAAMNPCPCGYAGSTTRLCRCTAEQVVRYCGRVSGPLLDRIDMHVRVLPVPATELLAEKQVVSAGAEAALDKARLSAQIEQAIACQTTRANKRNAQLTIAEIERDCELDRSSRALLLQAMQKFGLSARSAHRILKVARTIADLDGAIQIGAAQISEALRYRSLDKALASAAA